MESILKAALNERTVRNGKQVLSPKHWQLNGEYM